MKIKSDFEIVDIADEHLLVPVGKEATSFGGIVTLTEAAAFLLRKMTQPITREELILSLVEEYDVAEADARTDFARLMEDLTEMNIIEE